MIVKLQTLISLFLQHNLRNKLNSKYSIYQRLQPWTLLIIMLSYNQLYNSSSRKWNYNKVICNCSCNRNSSKRYMMHSIDSSWLMRRNNCCRNTLVRFQVLIQVVTCLPILVCNVQVPIAEISSSKLYYNRFLKLVLVLHNRNNLYSKRSRHPTILISSMKSQ